MSTANSETPGKTVYDKHGLTPFLFARNCNHNCAPRQNKERELERARDAQRCVELPPLSSLCSRRWSRIRFAGKQCGSWRNSVEPFSLFLLLRFSSKPEHPSLGERSLEPLKEHVEARGRRSETYAPATHRHGSLSCGKSLVALRDPSQVSWGP